jgi:hypothetical protein
MTGDKEVSHIFKGIPVQNNLKISQFNSGRTASVGLSG